MEVSRRRREALSLLRVRDKAEFKNEVRRSIYASLTKKQLEVIADIKLGIRYIAMACGRRAGKTNLLAKLLILTLLDCEHNEAVFYVAWSLKIGKGLIWKELEKLCHDYALDEYWRLTEHQGQIDTPDGAAFFILGLNKAKQSNLTRGFKGRLFCVDESQDVEHLLERTHVAVSPGLADTKGVFIAAGTGPYVTQGTWFEWSEGRKGFKAFNWTIRENEKFPQDPEETLREWREQNECDETHPDFIREWMGKAANDVTTLICEYIAERNSITELPEAYSLDWQHIIGMDFGWDDAITWIVVAVNPYGPERIVVHAEGASEMDNDTAADKTAELVKRFQTSYVVCDPAGGGKGFYKTFNSKYGKILGCQIKSAYKLNKVDSTKVINTDLRVSPPDNDNAEPMFGKGKARLVLLLPDAAPLEKEIKVLKWKNKQKAEVLTSKTVRDDHFDGFRYACAEIAPWQPKEEPSPEKKALKKAERELEAKIKEDPEVREREKRNKAARKQANGPWWGAR